MANESSLAMPEAQKVKRPRFSVVEALVCLGFLFLIFRFTAAAALLALGLLHLLFPLHRSRRAIVIVYILFFTALLVPVDVYIPGFHGPLIHSKHSGPRFVPVLYGLGARPGGADEAVLGGCVVSLNCTSWRLVWN
jgi:hypothetical protein